MMGHRLARGGLGLLLCHLLALGLALGPAAAAPLRSAHERYLASASQDKDGLWQKEDCVVRALPSIQFGCSGTGVPGRLNNRTAPGPRDALLKMLQECLSPTSARRALKLSVPDSVLAARIGPLTAAYSSLTGIPVRLSRPPIFTWYEKHAQEVRDAAIANATSDAWIMWASSFMGDGMRTGAFRNFTSLVALDSRLAWSGVIPLLRDAALLFDREVVALPMGAYSYHLFYRKDLFVQFNLTLPRTWGELIDFARAYNGTGNKWAFCGEFSLCVQYGVPLLTTIMFAINQRLGAADPIPATLESLPQLINNTGLLEALRIFKVLQQLSAPDNAPRFGCPLYSYRFVSGQCMLDISGSNTFKYASHPSRRNVTRGVMGSIGIAPFPGSGVVLDWESQKLISCTPQLCPHATRYTNPNGSTLLVNQAPLVETFSAMVNSYTPDDVAYMAFSVLSHLASAKISDQIVFDPDTEAQPIRTAQLDAKRWVAAGYNARDAEEYVSSYSAQLNHPNAALYPRYGGAFPIVLAVTNMVIQVLTMSPLRAMTNNAGAAMEVFRTAYGSNITDFLIQYYASVNRLPFPKPPSPSPPSVFMYPPAPNAPPQTSGSHLASLLVPLCVSLGAAVLIVAAIFVARRYGCFSKSVNPLAGAPGVSPFTTLCITDIEDSTNLWEEMTAQIMDAAVKMHDNCLRAIIAKYKGYESWWEGDSFIIAFHHPADALAFCMEAQTSLLQVPWPSEILTSTRCQEVWCVPSAPKAGKQKGGAKTNLRQRLSSLSSFHHGSTAPDTSSSKAQQLAAGQGTATVGDHFLERWQVSTSGAEGAVLAYRGLRVRMGLHSGVDSEANMTFSQTAQRVRYSGAIQSICNAVASAGKGGHTLISSRAAALLDSDSTGSLAGLPAGSSVYDMGQHTLTGVEAPQDLLLALPDSLQCRLSVQQAPLRTAAVWMPGILAAPVPSGTQADSCALVYVKFSGLSELLAWNQELTLQAVAAAAQCLRALVADMGGCLSEDGLQLVVSTRKAKNSPAAFPDSCTAGQVVIAFSSAAQPAAAHQPAAASSWQLGQGTQGPHLGVRFAQQLRNDLLMLDWQSDILNHDMCREVDWATQAKLPKETKTATMTTNNGPSSHAGQIMSSQDVKLSLDDWQPTAQAALLQTHSGAGYESPSGYAQSASLPPQSQLSASESASHADQASAAPVSQRMGSIMAHMPRASLLDSNSQISAGDGEWSQVDSSDRGSAGGQPHGLGKRSSMPDGAVRRRSLLFGAGFSDKLNATESQFDTLVAGRMRGLRCRMVALRAQGARFAIATRSTGRVVYWGPPVKEALRELAKTCPGQITVHRTLMNQTSPPSGIIPRTH